MPNIAGYKSPSMQGVDLSAAMQGSAGGFSPSDISDLIMWVDAAQGITLNGADVSQWDDQTVNGNDLIQGTAADQPVYNTSNANFNSRPTVDFDGVSEFMNTAAFTLRAQPNTIFIAARAVTTVANTYYFDGRVSNLRNLLASKAVTGVLTIFAGTANLDAGVEDTNTHIIGTRFSTTDSAIYTDGTATAGTTGSQGIDGFTVGARFSFTLFKNVECAEILLYDKKLTNTETNQVGNYLAEKYGTTWTDVSSFMLISGGTDKILISGGTDKIIISD